MATDLFDRLAELEIPPPPDVDEFDRQLHERVNRSLLVSQLIDLVIGGLPWAIAHFARALFATLTYTVKGHYDSKGKDARR